MSMDSWFPNPHDKDIAQLEEGLAYRAIKSGNNWILPSGKNAANGEPVVLDGVFGYATAAIVGGTDAIVEDTNWKPYGDGGALGAIKGINKIVYISDPIDKTTSGPGSAAYLFPAFTLPPGKYLIAEYGRSTIAGYLVSTAKNHYLPCFVELTEATSIQISSPTSSSATWSNYGVMVYKMFN